MQLNEVGGFAAHRRAIVDDFQTKFFGSLVDDCHKYLFYWFVFELYQQVAGSVWNTRDKVNVVKRIVIFVFISLYDILNFPRVPYGTIVGFKAINAPKFVRKERSTPTCPITFWVRVRIPTDTYSGSGGEPKGLSRDKKSSCNHWFNPTDGDHDAANAAFGTNRSRSPNVVPGLLFV